MQTKLLPVVLLAAISMPAIAQSDGSKPPISGVITRIASDSDFDFNGYRVVVSQATVFQVEIKVAGDDALESAKPADLQLHLGQALNIYGELTGKPAQITASRIVSEPAAQTMAVSGTAVIDAVLPVPRGTPATDHLVRADGYAIRITRATKLKYAKPLHSAADLHTNVWITYEGMLERDGSVHATKVLLAPNVISRTLDKEREAWEYDPAAVPASTHQSDADKILRGVNPADYPPYKDAAMQERIDFIGATLVPKYQFEFPFTEPTRIDFRFYLVDAPKWRDVAVLPNGIILVPYQLVKRLQNDSQVAALLADKMACLLEKQPVPLPASNSELVAGAAVDAAEFVAPLGGLAIGGATLPAGIYGAKQYHRNLQQRERVSLALLHDAGYDLLQAPIAFWLIAPKDPKPISEVPIPQQSAYLYEMIGQLWPDGAAPAGKADAGGE